MLDQMFSVTLVALIITQVAIITSSSRVKQFQSLEQKLENIAEGKWTLINLFERQLARLVSLSCDNREDCVDNPLAAFTLVRRLAHDWSALGIGINILSEKLLFLSNYRWPVEKDVSAAGQMLAKTQMVYNLSTSHLTQGLLTKGDGSAYLSGADCFSVAQHYYRSFHYPEAVEWLQQALSKISEDDTSVSNKEVLYHLAAALYLSGESGRSRATMMELRKKYPESHPPDSLSADFSKIASMGSKKLKQILTMYTPPKYYYPDFYKDLCRRDLSLKAELRCRYVHHNQPYLRLQPFKLEELQLEPPVFRFYDAVTDNESLIIRQEAKKRMKIAEVSGEGGKYEQSPMRTSHVAWLFPGEAELWDRLQIRIATMTQLNLKHAESHQVSRYGLAGEYLPHMDAFHPMMMPFERNRIATFMFYLTDVKQGGHTVFLAWDLSVPPVKNSAILWYNFHTNGNVDGKSIHSGCPVLKGSKWVLNKWIHNEGNEFTRPCGLHKNSSFTEYYQY